LPQSVNLFVQFSMLDFLVSLLVGNGCCAWKEVATLKNSLFDTIIIVRWMKLLISTFGQAWLGMWPGSEFVGIANQLLSLGAATLEHDFGRRSKQGYSDGNVSWFYEPAIDIMVYLYSKLRTIIANRGTILYKRIGLDWIGLDWIGFGAPLTTEFRISWHYSAQ
jgi:hypothetical protein